MSKRHMSKRRVLPREDVGGVAVREIRPGYWQVDFQRDGKRYRKAGFASLDDAKAHAAAMRTHIVKQGSTVLDLTPRLRLDAIEAVKRLEGTGVGLLGVVDEYLRRHPKAGGETIAQTCDKYLDAMRATGRRPLSIIEKKGKFKALREAMGDAATAGVDEAAIEVWAASRGVGKVTEAAYFGAGRAVLQFFRRGGRLKNRGNGDERPPVTWNMETVSKVLAKAETKAPEIAAALAILFFAGIRPHEIMRLKWSQIDLAAGVIRLTGEETKTRTMRNVDVPRNLRRWLRRYPGVGPIIPSVSRYRDGREAVMKAAGLTTWPVDVARHTFATMHYAAHQNAAATMAQLGHFGNPTTFLRHYKGVPVTADDAAEYWKINPRSKTARTAVRFPARRAIA